MGECACTERSPDMNKKKTYVLCTYPIPQSVCVYFIQFTLVTIHFVRTCRLLIPPDGDSGEMSKSSSVVLIDNSKPHFRRTLPPDGIEQKFLKGATTNISGKG